MNWKNGSISIPNSLQREKVGKWRVFFETITNTENSAKSLAYQSQAEKRTKMHAEMITHLCIVHA